MDREERQRETEGEMARQVPRPQAFSLCSFLPSLACHPKYLACARSLVSQNILLARTLVIQNILLSLARLNLQTTIQQQSN